MCKFEAESKEYGVMYSLVTKQVIESKEDLEPSIPQEIQPLLNDFYDLIPKQLPNELPPL